MNIIKKLFVLTTSILMIFTLSVSTFTNATKVDLRENIKNNPIPTPNHPIARSNSPVLNYSDSVTFDVPPNIIINYSDSVTFELPPNFNIKVFKLFANYDYGNRKAVQEYLPENFYYITKNYKNLYTIFYTTELDDWIAEKKKVFYEKDENIIFFDIYLEAEDDTGEKFVTLALKRVALYNEFWFDPSV